MPIHNIITLGMHNNTGLYKWWLHHFKPPEQFCHEHHVIALHEIRKKPGEKLMSEHKPAHKQIKQRLGDASVFQPVYNLHLFYNLHCFFRNRDQYKWSVAPVHNLTRLQAIGLKHFITNICSSPMSCREGREDQDEWKKMSAKDQPLP